jgi:Retrotransposon gag protein
MADDQAQAPPPPPPPQPGALMFEAARQLELSKIPLFFGDPAKDHFTPETWLYRLEQARIIGNWNDQNTAIYMNMSFRENAIRWRDALRDMGQDTEDWPTLRAAFLRFYAPSATIRSCVANLDLKQGATETVRDYGPRVARVVHDIRQTLQPYNMPAFLCPPEVEALNGYNAIDNDILINFHAAIVRAGEQRMADLMSIHIFVAGLKPYLRDKCVTRVFNTYYDAYTHATQLEHNMSDPKKSPHVSEVKSDDKPPEDSEILELEQQIEALRTVYNKKLQSRNRFQRGGSQRFGQRRDYSAYACRYCNIKGHIQAQCRKRIAAGAPMVDNKGNAMKQVREVDGGDSNDTTTNSSTTNNSASTYNPFIASISNNPHLNYY